MLKKTFVQRFPVTSMKLRIRSPVEEVEVFRTKKQKQGKTKYFIRHNITDTSEAEMFFKCYEDFTTTYMINDYSEISGVVQE